MSATRHRPEPAPSAAAPPSSRVRFRPGRPDASDDLASAPWLEPCIEEVPEPALPEPVPYVEQLTSLLLDNERRAALVVTESGDVLMANAGGRSFANACTKGELVAVLASLAPGPHSGFQATLLTAIPSSPRTYLLVRHDQQARAAMPVKGSQ